MAVTNADYCLENAKLRVEVERRDEHIQSFREECRFQRERAEKAEALVATLEKAVGVLREELANVPPRVRARADGGARLEASAGLSTLAGILSDGPEPPANVDR